jgi:cobalt/nickel transport system permease protein
MHLENGAVTPACAAIAFGASTLAISAACITLRRQSEPFKHLGLAVTLGSAVFVAQMINFPISGVSSAHLIGGALLAWALGPAAGLITMALVLLAQALCLGDGGLLSLGANTLNMAVLPALAVHMVKNLSFTKSKSGQYAGLAMASFIATIAGAALLVGEVGLFRVDSHTGSFSSFAGMMLSTHAFMAVIEAALACAVLFAIRQFITQDGQARRSGNVALAGAALALLALVPFGSQLRDGYEAAAHAAGLSDMINSPSQPGQIAASLQQITVSLWPSQELLHAGLVTLAFAGALALVLWAVGRSGKQTRLAAQ